MKDKQYDIALVVLGSLVAFFISIAANAFYDFFKTIVQTNSESENALFTFQFVFIFGALGVAIYIFKKILKNISQPTRNAPMT
ncbi:MAG: hypothetical protein RLZZ480_898 [Candidatus Parcubacteria bacterium]|jgi:uncharacterized membrane protein